MNIVVLAGGISTEREISIVSGTGVCKALRTKNHRSVLVDVYCGLENPDQENMFPQEYDVDQAAAYIRSFDSRLEEMKKNRREFFGPNVLDVCKAADIVFLALHGEAGENGKLQAAFDLHGIRYTGTGHLGSGMAMDKGITKKIFSTHQVPTPPGVTLIKGVSSSKLEDYGMKLPVVVKPCCGGSSVGVVIADNEKDYDKAVEQAFSYEDEIVVERYIVGREFSVGVIAGKALPVIEIQPLQGFYDYKNKYQPGSTVETCPAQLAPELTKMMQKYARKGHEALALEAYSRLDFIMEEDGSMYCLEANTLPGMTPTSLMPQEAQAVGMDYPAFCEELIRVSLDKYL